MKISQYTLVMLIVGAVDGLRNLPSIAIFGQQLIFFFIVASLLFLLPVGLISAELCAQFKEESGIYAWTKKAFGGHLGMVAIWLQWINTMVWFPTCLTALVGTAIWLLNPALAQNVWFLVITSLSVFWFMTMLNLYGVKQSAKIASWASTIGMLIPVGIIIFLSFLWIVLDKPRVLTLNTSAIFPPLTHLTTWSSLTAIITAFLGMELATVHVRKVPDAYKIFPRALMYAILVIIFTMGFGSLAVALVIPQKEITLVAGTIQVFERLFQGFHVPWLDKVLGLMLILGSLGAMVSWLISPANGLAAAARDDYLPKTLARENTHGVPYKIFILQAIVVSLVTLAFFLLPNVNGSYWLLLDLSTEIYVTMYVLMFFAAIKMIFTLPKIQLIPGGKYGALGVSILGLLGCAVTLVVGFIPPDSINVGGHLHYMMLFSGGMFLLISPCLLLKWHHNRFFNRNVNEKLLVFEKS